MVKTKIIATLGPASGRENELRKMFVKGLDIARLNFSHGTHNEHIEKAESVRRLNKKMKRAVKIMQDLEGYRIRIGKLKEDIYLKKNSILYLKQTDKTGSGREVPFDYWGPLSAFKSGNLIFVDDGKILLKVIARTKRSLKTKVLSCGILKSKKGINIIDVDLPFEALTAKDKADLAVGVKYRFDYLAQSFVRSAKDIHILKSILSVKHPRCKVFAKVENKQALKNIDEIIREADGIIVARGDLGICLPIYKVSIFQKEIIRKCRVHKKPVVVATQMLDSMTEENLPTRAEVSDVTNAILDGATHLLLSGETAVGKHPSSVVDMMNKIIKVTERYREKGNFLA